MVIIAAVGVGVVVVVIIAAVGVVVVVVVTWFIKCNVIVLSWHDFFFFSLWFFNLFQNFFTFDQFKFNFEREIKKNNFCYKKQSS